MQKFREKMIRFMVGRYGMDQLYMVLIVIGFILMIVNMFVNTWLLSIASWVVLIFAFYRVFSKNIVQRRKEFDAWMRFSKVFRDAFALQKKRWQDRHTKRYRKCPNCKTVLRLPVKKGTNTVKCPKCGTGFQVRVLW